MMKIFFCCLSRWISVPVDMVHTWSFELSTRIIKKDKNKRKYIYRRWILNLNPKSISMNNFFSYKYISSHKFRGNNIIKLDRDFAFFLSKFLRKSCHRSNKTFFLLKLTENAGFTLYLIWINSIEKSLYLIPLRYNMNLEVIYILETFNFIIMTIGNYRLLSWDIGNSSNIELKLQKF